MGQFFKCASSNSYVLPPVRVTLKDRGFWDRTTKFKGSVGLGPIGNYKSYDLPSCQTPQSTPFYIFLKVIAVIVQLDKTLLLGVSNVTIVMTMKVMMVMIKIIVMMIILTIIMIMMIIIIVVMIIIIFYGYPRSFNLPPTAPMDGGT